MRNLPSPFGLKSPFGFVARFFGWIINGFTLEGVPRTPSAATPTITGTILSGPYGTYFATNTTTLVETEITLTSINPTYNLAPLGTAGQNISVVYVNLSSQSGVITVPGAYTLTEDYTGYGANGAKDWATVFEALWTRQGTETNINLASDTDGINGKRISLEQTTTTARYIYRDDTRIPDNAWETMQIRGRARIAAANDYGGVGWGSASGFFGIHIRGSSTNVGRVAYVNNGDMATASPGTALLSSVADTTAVEFLIDIASDKRTVQFKAWTLPGSEPGTWGGSYTLGADISFSNGLRLFSKVDGAAQYGLRTLGWRMAVNGTAAAF
jgi:hypothetical protein